MIENFISEIFVKKSRNIKDFLIPLSLDSRKHLIITGKNGSGKTSLLLEIDKFLSKTFDGQYEDIQQLQENKQFYINQLENINLKESNRISFQSQLDQISKRIKAFGDVNIKFSNSLSSIYEKAKVGNFIIAYFDAKRHTNLNVPIGINKIDLKKKYDIKERANVNFIQYIVNLKADRSFARDDNEMQTVESIDKWFNNFEERLRTIFDDPSLQLVFDRKKYNFDIKLDDKESFGFNTLSDGYSAIISIITEILLRMESNNSKSYDVEGVVIIDEIDTHLHVDLQKKILPFLVDFFPRIQFIVTTHSPFVLSSLSNTTICDLEAKMITEDLSGYSYDALIESFFKSDKYSIELKDQISEFEKLISIESPTIDDKLKIEKIKDYLSTLPKYLSKELHSKLLDIEINYLSKKKD